MDVFEAIAQRRSIRQFKDTPIPKEVLLKILEAGTQAPSGKNAQPWRFVVVQEDKRAAMVHVMREGIANLKAQGIDTGSAPWTAKVMEQAPVTVFVFNAEVEGLNPEKPIPALTWELVNVQSSGHSEYAPDNGGGPGAGRRLSVDWGYLHTSGAYRELCEWLDQTHEMVAAVSFGYPDEQPQARPRKSVDEVTTWH